MILCLAGPTAVGKTEFAISLAERLDAEIVGADAFQIYAGLDRLTAKPTPEERNRIRHHLIGTIPLSENFDAARYRASALEAINDITRRGKQALVVGGSGFYFSALLHGLPDLPNGNPTLRAELDSLDLEQLQTRYLALDPAGFEKIDRMNRRRLIRAIEVSELAGKPFSTFRRENAAPLLPARGWLLLRPREELYRRIDDRVLHMFATGVIDEVRDLPALSDTARQAIGIDQIQALLRGAISREECIAQVQQATRHYAKRQLTWFKREPIFEPILLPTHANFSSLFDRIVPDAVMPPSHVSMHIDV
jgi:tRNA dimethylallyltransferase